MRYLLPFSRIRVVLDMGDKSASMLVRRFDDVCDMIRHLLVPARFDDAWYCTAYPDVASALSRTDYFESAAQHFVTVGYFESRLPFEHETELHRRPPPFAAVRKMLTAKPTRAGLMVEIAYPAFLDMIRQLLAAIPVDGAWYRHAYPDVGAAIAAGHWSSAAAHFTALGYFEGRWPFDIPVDDAWYCGTYPDVAAAVAADHWPSATGHFKALGYGEGRQPQPDSLRWLTGAA